MVLILPLVPGGKDNAIDRGPADAQLQFLCPTIVLEAKARFWRSYGAEPLVGSITVGVHGLRNVLWRVGQGIVPAIARAEVARDGSSSTA